MSEDNRNRRARRANGVGKQRDRVMVGQIAAVCGLVIAGVGYRQADGISHSNLCGLARRHGWPKRRDARRRRSAPLARAIKREAMHVVP